MGSKKLLSFIEEVINNAPKGWLSTTTHRLDIYEEKLAKVQFLEGFEELFQSDTNDTSSLDELPTAYDYIRLGHPLSCVLEWTIAKLNEIEAKQVISFSSETIGVLAILRKNFLDNKETQINYSGALPECFDAELIQKVYGYNFSLRKVENIHEITPFDGSSIFISQKDAIASIDTSSNVDFFIHTYSNLGSIVMIYGKSADDYISSIQHVRRRETIAMTPINCFDALSGLVNQPSIQKEESEKEKNKNIVIESIQDITGSKTKVITGSSGLSIQYAIMMGLIHDAKENHKGKDIKVIVPPNCYGGTNDQARRVAACIDNVEIVDLHVDGENDMVQSIDTILDGLAFDDAIPYIIAEIPTNPRVEVPDLIQLKEVLSRSRKTADGSTAVDPVFILDQTFCPNVQFLGEGKILSSIRTIVYASGSKFPSGGLCTSGFCVGNQMTEELMQKIELHLDLCDNEATELQYSILANQLPSMLDRIQGAYENTREFVSFIQKTLPKSKINFVSEALANEGFTPSVFSLDLPTKGGSAEEKEAYKRALNLKLINLMITEIPDESKFCVSYGQLKGCYWTIPATSTQGTTKEGDKDYIVRTSLSQNMNLDKHKEVFAKFVASIYGRKKGSHTRR